MTDYSKTTDFTGKNSLPDSDPDKIISGVDFDLEFNAVAAASASKADTTYVDAADALKLDKTGGIVSGDLGVTGDIDADGNVVADGYILGNASLVSQSNYPVVTAKHATVLSGDLDNAGGRFQITTQDNAFAGQTGFLGNDQKYWTFKNFKSVPEWRWNDGSDVINARLLGGNLSLPLSTPTSDDHAMTRGAADARYAGITYVDSKTSIAYGQIVGLAGEIITEGLVGCSAVIATDGVITVTNTASVPATANMVINATVGKWFQPTTNPKCSLTAIPTSASTWDVRVFDASDTLVPKASIGAYLFSFSVLDNS